MSWKVRVVTAWTFRILAWVVGLGVLAYLVAMAFDNLEDFQTVAGLLIRLVLDIVISMVIFSGLKLLGAVLSGTKYRDPLPLFGHGKYFSWKPQ